jgi:uncharacterized protein (UPF0332 family)
VTPEAAGRLDKARQFLTRARIILNARVVEDAARDAYLAALHAAQALIVERTGKGAKTHKGAHVQFARLTRHEPRLDPELRRFLPQSYDMKATADYETGPDAVIPQDEAAAAIETATRFVECIAELLASRRSTSRRRRADAIRLLRPCAA